MRTSTALLLSFFFSANHAAPQSLRYSVAAPYTGMGAYSSKQADPFSFTGNQASLAGMHNAGFGIYGERRYMLSETSSYNLAAVFPNKIGNLGLQLNYAGFKNFNENKIGLAYGRSLGSKADVGIQFSYYDHRIPAYGNSPSLNVEAGAIFHFTRNLNGGIHMLNPMGSKHGKTAVERPASAYKFGLGYDASDNFFVGTEIIKEEEKPVNVNVGIRYRLGRQFFASGGISGASGAAYFGAGIGWKELRIDLSVSYHPLLGVSPGFLLIFDLKNTKK